MGIGNLRIAIGARRRGGSKPAAPLNLAASVVDEVSIALTWDAVTGADSYKIYYGTDGVTFGSSTTSATNSKTVAGLTADTTYYFYVAAVKGTTEGTASATVSDKTYNYFSTSAVTTGVETLTLERIDVKAGESITIDWGDGNSNTYNDAGVTRTHPYAGAGTWAVKISGARFISNIDLRDAKLRFNSSSFRSCGDNLLRIYMNTILKTPVINSADMAHLNLQNTLFLNFTQPGTYSINTSHFAAYTLISSYFIQCTQPGIYVTSRDDFSGFINAASVQVSMNLVSADVDKILLGFYDAFPSKTNTGGAINLTGNQAPTGTYQAKVPPTTGKEAAYELLNDSGGVSSLHWATIIVEGGGTP